MESDHPCVITIELDGIVTHQEPVSASDFMPLTSLVSVWSVPKLLANVGKLSNDFCELEKTVHGTANIFMSLADLIKSKYKVNIDGCAPKLVQAFAKPRIDFKVVQELKRLKEKSGYRILAVTHYDYEHFRAYLEKIEIQKETNFDELFDGYITARFNHLPDQDESAEEPFVCLVPEKKIFMACAQDAVQPKAQGASYPLKTVKYFDITRSAAHKIAGGYGGKCIHIDPCEQCATMAGQHPDFRALCYDPRRGLEEQIEEIMQN